MLTSSIERQASRGPCDMISRRRRMRDGRRTDVYYLSSNDVPAPHMAAWSPFPLVILPQLNICSLPLTGPRLAKLRPWDADTDKIALKGKRHQQALAVWPVTSAVSRDHSYRYWDRSAVMRGKSVTVGEYPGARRILTEHDGYRSTYCAFSALIYDCMLPTHNS